MKKLFKQIKEIPKKTKAFLGIILCLIIVMIGILISLLFSKSEKRNNSAENKATNVIENKVNADEATNMYNDITKDCTGALVFDSKEGEQVDIENINDYTSACKTNDYYSKMIGYTYDLDCNVVIHVNILKKINDKLYDLKDNEIAGFSENTVKESLNKGTTYEYIYKEENGSYNLIEVKLMK